MAQLLIDRGIFAFHKHHHWLGANAGLALEVPSLIKMNVLDTLDSSNPVWHALLGHEYTSNSDSFLSVSKVHFPVQFDLPMTSDRPTLDRIQHNVALSLQLFGQTRDAEAAGVFSGAITTPSPFVRRVLDAECKQAGFNRMTDGGCV
jgi:hypothetical protein